MMKNCERHGKKRVYIVLHRRRMEMEMLIRKRENGKGMEKGKKGLDSGEAMATRDGVGRAPGAAAAL